MKNLEKTIKNCESFIKELFEKRIIIETTRNELLGHLYQTRDGYLKGDKNYFSELEFMNEVDRIYKVIRANVGFQIQNLRQGASLNKRKNDLYEFFTEESMKNECPYSADELIKLYINLQKKYS